MGPFELDVRGADTERFQHDQVGDQRADPCDHDIGIDAQDRFQRREDPEEHQQKRNQHVEYQPDDPARMVVSQPRENVRPGERPGVGVGDVDLDLRDHDEHRGHDQYDGTIVENVLVALDVHVHRNDGVRSVAPARITRNARNPPARIFRPPMMIQPGPADSRAAHQADRFRAFFSGRKRR